MRMTGRVVFIFAASIFFSFTPAYSDESLLGDWRCQGPEGQISLIFQSKDLLVFDGDQVNYTLAPGKIRVREDMEIVDYRYTLKGNSLTIYFPEGFSISCRRETDAAGGQKNSRDKSLKKTGQGNTHQLYGTLCSWSGSSTSSSSYSSSTKVTFDGRGRFSYGSESSFSGNAGQAFGAGPGSGGSYRVEGNNVYLTFGDGSTAQAVVNFRQADGSISEVMYGKQLFGKGLCQ